MILRNMIWAIGIAYSTGTPMLPEPPDLKAAFCLGAMKNHVPITMDNLFIGKPPDNPELRQELARVEDKFQSAHRRLQAYLLPRLRYLDADAMLLAAKAGEAAALETDKAISACSGSGPCMERARLRTKDCYEPGFLPF